ncbi:MAG: phosphocholine cytidylyltransferase family protein [Proteobacteria bacterium]|nr:phosphocholine cytidylyltransferase family protein [Pseudomonadota bacterium]
MKGIILAAGVASRLRPLTDNLPKCLLEIGDRCLLERTVLNLLKHGIRDLIIVTGYLSDMIRSFMADRFPDVSVTFIHNDQYETTNNIYSLWLSRDHATGHDMMLLDSDIVFDDRILKALLSSPYENCLALIRHELGEEEIKVIVDGKNKITEISKVCAISKAIGESLGIEKFSKTLVDRLFDELEHMMLRENLVNVFYEKAFERIIKNGASIYPVDITGLFSMELDTVADFNQAKNAIPEHLL